MKTFGRSEAGAAVLIVAAVGLGWARWCGGQTGGVKPEAAPGGGTMGAARAIPYESMPVRPNASGGESRDIAHGTLATGETVNLHQTMQVAGQPAPALHTIQHSEFICVREGEVEFDHEVDGKMVAERVGPGGVFYVAYGTRHAIKNAGAGPARYFVVAIGGDAK
jgi:mannose-6-phosphate isomerase-like protein (cupin superfamily)